MKLKLIAAALLCISSFCRAEEEKGFVIANIYGQLGNNLFQVAAASALAWDNGVDPYFPSFRSSSPVYQRVFFRVNRRPPHQNISFEWNEPSYAYTPIPYQPNMRMIGYFQSEKYFAHHRERLLELFAPHPDDLAYMKQKYQWLFEHPNTVGVQLRYYKFEFPTEDLYPQYGRDYLEKAMAVFPKSALFVVSSNNLDFAKKSIPHWVKNVVFIENEPHYIDFYLLSFCKHNIITNSSFGWWSAWLNQNPNKIVICPSLWIKGFPTQDACPKEWFDIEAKYE
ncbi:MAG: alpha-1,2-fucosyltransferase [Chlamydiales bacterium]|nr:alpha-1,2-fucosyltransferase [Chlamydiales bacterium]